MLRSSKLVGYVNIDECQRKLALVRSLYRAFIGS